VDVATDREEWMLYSSFLRAQGPGLIWAYGPGAPGAHSWPVLGITAAAAWLAWRWRRE
jgi:hypothetical protein